MDTKYRLHFHSDHKLQHFTSMAASSMENLSGS